MPVGNSNGKVWEDEFEATLDSIKRPPPEAMRDNMEIDPVTREEPEFDPSMKEPAFIPASDAGETSDSQVPSKPPRTIQDILTGADGGERYQLWPEKMVRSLGDSVRKLATGEVDPTSPEGVAASTEVAGALILGPGAPLALGKKIVSGDSLGSFIGAGAKTINREALDKARAMDRKGHTPDEIWKETQTFKGPDGNWRQELDASEMEFKMPPKDVFDPKLDTKVSGPIEEFVHWPDFYKAYPEAKNLTVELDQNLPAVGRFNTKEGKLTLNPTRMEFAGYDYKGVFAHELQHYIQRAEGWAGGSNPAYAQTKWEILLGEKIAGAEARGDTKLLSELKNLESELRQADMPKTWWNGDGTLGMNKGMDFSNYIYRGNPGEREAELARHSQPWTAEERASVSPQQRMQVLEDQGTVPREFRFPDEGYAGAVDMAGPARAPFPEGYLEKVPAEQRMSLKGVSHPGFRWEVFDRQTGEVVRKGLETRGGATRSADRLDNQYGAYRYSVRNVVAKAKQLTEAEKKFLEEHKIKIQQYEGD